jgi:hypothetical protein
MVDYIKQIAQSLIDEPPKAMPIFIVQALSEEFQRLDPRDFLPAAQANVVRARISLKALLKGQPPGPEFLETGRRIAKSVCEIIDLYGGDASRAVSRSFKFVKRADLRTIIERDYRELALILLPGGAWKSTVVMAGSILEAILFDQLTADAAVKAKALADSKAPKKLDLGKGEWRLHDLIGVSVELGLLPAPRADAIDIVLRDYRNFVHPMKELRSAHPCTEAEALMAKGALDSVYNHLTPP